MHEDNLLKNHIEDLCEGSYHCEEIEEILSSEMLELAQQTKEEAQQAIDHIVDLQTYENKIKEDSSARGELENHVDALVTEALIDSLDARAMLESAHYNAQTAVTQAEKIKALCEEDVRNAESLLVAKRNALIEAQQLLEKAKQSENEISGYGLLKKESKTARAARLNDGTMVTVVCITYKHEEFIAQALDSFLMQKTNFKFKVFVGEDCGPDGTADIVREYAARYPDIIVPFLREKNMGAQRNLIDMCQQATSPYIAFCEGDDYWVDEYKLQKQFDYMETHKNIRVCTTKTEILAPKDWHLRSWYKPLPDGRILMPDSTPGYVKKDSYSPASLIELNVAHTSTFFFRWNYDLKIPDWYYAGYVGDMPLLLMQMGTTNLIQLDSVCSVYRINEGSAFFNKNREQHFLKTRVEYVRYLTGIRQYATENFKNYPIVAIENRIKLESANYLNVLIKKNMTDEIAKFFAQYPGAAKVSLNAYLSFYNDSRLMTGAWGWEGYKLAVQNKYYRNALKPIVKFFLRVEKWKIKWKKPIDKFKKWKSFFKGKCRNLAALSLYWRYTLTPKNNNLWVFSGFDRNNYMDNSKYLYEYVLEHNPEIQAVWLTRNQEIFNRLRSEGKPVVMQRTAECKQIISKAAVAVIDHFKMSDTDSLSGFNHGTKVVQLWHGVGLKSMQDVVNETTVPGVRYDRSKILEPKDSVWTRIGKKIWYFRHAYYTERFEDYFMLLCPGNERIEQIAKTMKIPLDRCFMSGHPRNICLHQSEYTGNYRDILYAPTFRWNQNAEKRMLNQILESAEEIETFLSGIDRNLVIRLHPLTWRNYNGILSKLEEEYQHIRIDREKDIYETLGSYEILITDYSSIAYDFVLVDRPVVFFNFDFEEYSQQDHALNYDYEEYTPGQKTRTWRDTMDAVQEYLNSPEKDGEWRRRIRDEFYDMSVNDEHNSERIVQEIKRRLREEK